MSFCDHADFRAMAVARATTRFTMVSLLERSHFWGSRRLVMILDIRAIQKSHAKSKPMLFLNHLEQACPNAQLRPTDGTLRCAPPRLWLRGATLRFRATLMRQKITDIVCRKSCGGVLL